MPRPEKSSFSPEHIAEFQRIQALRPVALRNFADGLGVWRGCRNAACRRGRGCRDSHAFTCLRDFMRALPEEDNRLLRHMVENRAKGLSLDEAAGQALMRIDAERESGADVTRPAQAVRAARQIAHCRRQGGSAMMVR